MSEIAVPLAYLSSRAPIRKSNLNSRSRPTPRCSERPKISNVHVCSTMTSISICTKSLNVDKLWRSPLLWDFRDFLRLTLEFGDIINICTQRSNRIELFFLASPKVWNKRLDRRSPLLVLFLRSIYQSQFYVDQCSCPNWNHCSRAQYIAFKWSKQVLHP